MTELTFEELGTALDAVRCSIREQEYLIDSIEENELRNRPASYPQDPCEEHFAPYRDELREQKDIYFKQLNLCLKIKDMLRERQPE